MQHNKRNHVHKQHLVRENTQFSLYNTQTTNNKQTNNKKSHHPHQDHVPSPPTYWYACPLVCRLSLRPITILVPIAATLFIMLITRVSLPGMTLALYSSRSLG